MATREDWARRVERWKASGLTAKVFARRFGVSERSLSWWSWRLKSLGETATERPTASALSPMTFVEMTAAIPREPLELVLPGGRRVRVPADFDASALERLLEVLERRR